MKKIDFSDVIISASNGNLEKLGHILDVLYMEIRRTLTIGEIGEAYKMIRTLLADLGLSLVLMGHGIQIDDIINDIRDTIIDRGEMLAKSLEEDSPMGEAPLQMN